jgi:hypothetical protein
MARARAESEHQHARQQPASIGSAQSQRHLFSTAKVIFGRSSSANGHAEMAPRLVMTLPDFRG